MTGDHRAAGEPEEGGANLPWRGLRAFLSSLRPTSSLERGARQQLGPKPWPGRAGSTEVVLSTPPVPTRPGRPHLLPLELADADLQGVQGGPGLGAVHGDGPLGAVAVRPAARAPLAAPALAPGLPVPAEAVRGRRLRLRQGQRGRRPGQAAGVPLVGRAGLHRGRVLGRLLPRLALRLARRARVRADLLRRRLRFGRRRLLRLPPGRQLPLGAAPLHGAQGRCQRLGHHRRRRRRSAAPARDQTAAAATAATRSPPEPVAMIAQASVDSGSRRLGTGPGKGQSPIKPERPHRRGCPRDQACHRGGRGHLGRGRKAAAGTPAGNARGF